MFDFTTINDVAYLAGFVSAMPTISCMFELLKGAKMLNFLLITCIIYFNLLVYMCISIRNAVALLMFAFNQ